VESPVTTYLGESRDATGTLVIIFLRGGADGLNMVIPHGDDQYHAARPGLAIKRPDLVDLDGFFGLNHHLKPLHAWWRSGDLSIIHCAGSEDESRSHFKAQDFMEHGGLAAGGWLGRFLRARPDAGQSPLTAVAIGTTLPEVLRGAPSSAAIQSLEEFGLGPGVPPGFLNSLAALYQHAPRKLGPAGRNALAALERIHQLTTTRDSPDHGASDPADPFANGLHQIARLIKARVGLQAATIDLGGWDSHLTQPVIMDPPMQRLASGLHALATDLGPRELARTQIIVMTEFGRRVAENSAAGTDHGRGGVMFLLGGGVKGGSVHMKWPDLASQLAGPGDLPVLNNYRDILAPILTRQAPGTDLASVFPGHIVHPLAESLFQ
jgi:uncharacterized protein (DUF1501 family)